MPAASARSGSRSRNSSASNSRSRRRRGSAKGDRSIVSVLVCLALGIVAGLLAMHYAAVLTLMGPHAFMLLYPWVAFFEGHPVGLSFQNASAIGQMLVYLQFPAYGLLAGMVLFFSRRISRTLLVLLAAHALGVLLVVAQSFLHHV